MGRVWHRAEGSGRSGALDAVCALGVAATGADLAIVTRLGAEGHGIAGMHGSLAEGWSALLDEVVTLEQALAGAGSVEALTLRVGDLAVGMVLLARREGAFGARERAVLFRLQVVAEAQMSAEDVLADVARAAFHRIESARA